MERKRGLQRGFVLHARPYSNTSLLLELLSAEEGRCPAVARGAKGRRSTQSGLLRPFQPLLLELTGRGEVATVARVEPGGRPLSLIGEAGYCGLYVNELMMRLLGRGDPQADLFALYEEVLTRLSVEPERGLLLRRFELEMLKILGYALVLDHDVSSGEPVRADRRYAYLVEQGPVEVLEAARSPQVVSGATLLALRNDADPGVAGRVEARRLMRAVLDHHLGGRPLKSRELFRPRRAGSIEPETSTISDHLDDE